MSDLNRKIQNKGDVKKVNLKKSKKQIKEEIANCSSNNKEILEAKKLADSQGNFPKKQTSGKKNFPNRKMRIESRETLKRPNFDDKIMPKTNRIQKRKISELDSQNEKVKGSLKKKRKLEKSENFENLDLEEQTPVVENKTK